MAMASEVPLIAVRPSIVGHNLLLEMMKLYLHFYLTSKTIYVTFETFFLIGHPHKMFRFPSPDRPFFLEK